MINSGLINGVPVHADYNILTNLLRKETIKKVQLNILGKHNIQNSLAAVTVAKILNININDLKNKILIQKINCYFLKSN